MITKRQQDVVFDNGNRVLVCDSSCRTAEVVKWSVFLGLFGLFFLYVTIGYWHARRRVRKGLPPLKYHKWLAPRNGGLQNNYGYYNNNPQYAYGMQNFPEPPPIYNPAGMPPAYAPPPGGSKIAPQQNGTTGTTQSPPQIPPQTVQHMPPMVV